MHSHNAEHGVLQLDGVKALLPLGHRGVDVHAETQHTHTHTYAWSIRMCQLAPHRLKLTSRSEPPATWLAERCSSSEPPLSSGPALLCSRHPLAARSPCSSQTGSGIVAAGSASTTWGMSNTASSNKPMRGQQVIVWWVLHSINLVLWRLHSA